MNARDRNVLNQKRSFILDNLIVDEVFWSKLLESKVLTESWLEDIKALETRTHQVTRLLDIVPKRGKDALQNFIAALLDTEQSHIADELSTAQVKEEVASIVTEIGERERVMHVPQQKYRQRLGTAVEGLDAYVANKYESKLRAEQQAVAELQDRLTELESQIRECEESRRHEQLNGAEVERERDEHRQTSRDLADCVLALTRAGETIMQNITPADTFDDFCQEPLKIMTEQQDKFVNCDEYVHEKVRCYHLSFENMLRNVTAALNKTMSDILNEDLCRNNILVELSQVVVDLETATERGNLMDIAKRLQRCRRNVALLIKSKQDTLSIIDPLLRDIFDLDRLMTKLDRVKDEKQKLEKELELLKSETHIIGDVEEDLKDNKRSKRKIFDRIRQKVKSAQERRKILLSTFVRKQSSENEEDENLNIFRCDKETQTYAKVIINKSNVNETPRTSRKQRDPSPVFYRVKKKTPPEENAKGEIKQASYISSKNSQDGKAPNRTQDILTKSLQDGVDFKTAVSLARTSSKNVTDSIQESNSSKVKQYSDMQTPRQGKQKQNKSVTFDLHDGRVSSPQHKSNREVRGQPVQGHSDQGPPEMHVTIHDDTETKAIKDSYPNKDDDNNDDGKLYLHVKGIQSNSHVEYLSDDEMPTGISSSDIIQHQDDSAGNTQKHSGQNRFDLTGNPHSAANKDKHENNKPDYKNTRKRDQRLLDRRERMQNLGSVNAPPSRVTPNGLPQHRVPSISVDGGHTPRKGTKAQYTAREKQMQKTILKGQTFEFQKVT